MFKYLIIVFAVISGALIWINFGVGVQAVYKEEIPKPSAPHIYNDPGQPIENIEILALYFVPKNKTHQQIENWKEILEENLKKLQEFHDLQFRGRSRISYKILDKLVTGTKINLEYDTNVTQHGNPEGLRRISNELLYRLSSQGDLYQSGLINKDSSAYKVILILYEGVGASGSEDVALVSRTFFTDPQFSDIAATTLTHEFYHTLGLPDAYEIPSAVPTSLDIMGLGLSRPLERNYIAREFLKGMGL
ncbi:MAG: hypothetical protein Q8R55_05900 [Candidatus Taylorbacteria bacterium]|nr:hypothetical protein [Candidatus Taylorbacteria bacterium]